MKHYFMIATALSVVGLWGLYLGVNHPIVSKPPVMQHNHADHSENHSK